MISVRASVTPVGRLAPSPTGELHLGHARSFVIAWWHTRSRGGRLVLRLEDLDSARTQPEFVAQTLHDLRWLGLDWDEPVLHQSKRVEAIREAAFGLVARGLAYPCVCSRGEILSVVGAPHADSDEPRYPGTCRGRWLSVEQAERETGKSAGLRFRVPSAPVHFHDAVHGACTYDLDDGPGDFLILRRDQTPAYQLAVVVDDAFQGVTEVVRGDDLLSSTPRQLALIRALGFSEPHYAHLPLVLDATGRRLAKREHSLSLRSLRDGGVDPRTLIRWIARGAGLAPLESSVANASELCHSFARTFDSRRLPKTPVVIDDDTILKWSHED